MENKLSSNQTHSGDYSRERIVASMWETQEIVGYNIHALTQIPDYIHTFNLTQIFSKLLANMIVHLKQYFTEHNHFKITLHVV